MAGSGETLKLHCEYLVVGCGAAAIAFVDTLLTEWSGSEPPSVIMVDRREKPGKTLICVIVRVCLLAYFKNWYIIMLCLVQGDTGVIRIHLADSTSLQHSTGSIRKC